MHLKTKTLDVEHTPDYLSADVADALYAYLSASPDLEQRTIRYFGRDQLQPRLTAYYSPTPYEYSGTIHQPRPMPEPLDALRRKLEADTGERYNTVLVNLYRDGQDSIGWHADDELLLGLTPAIASVSLGSTRKFKMRPTGSTRAEHSLELAHGSLVVMRGWTQQFWQHHVPRTARPVGPRINLTFRLMPEA